MSWIGAPLKESLAFCAICWYVVLRIFYGTLGQNQGAAFLLHHCKVMFSVSWNKIFYLMYLLFIRGRTTWFWCGQHPIRGPKSWVGPENRDFWDPEMATSKVSAIWAPKSLDSSKATIVTYHRLTHKDVVSLKRFVAIKLTCIPYSDNNHSWLPEYN